MDGVLSYMIQNFEGKYFRKYARRKENGFQIKEALWTDDTFQAKKWLSKKTAKKANQQLGGKVVGGTLTVTHSSAVNVKEESFL